MRDFKLGFKGPLEGGGERLEHLARYAATHGKAFVEESTTVPHETQEVVIVWVYRYDAKRVLYIGLGDEG